MLLKQWKLRLHTLLFHVSYCNPLISILSSGVSAACLSLICYNLVSLSSGVSTANLSPWLVLIRCNLSLSSRVSAASLSLICCNFVSLSSGVSAASLPYAVTSFLSRQGFHLLTFRAGWCSSAVIFLLGGVSPANLSCWLVLICCNLVSLSSGVSAASLSLICCNLVSLSSGVSAASLSAICCNLVSLSPSFRAHGNFSAVRQIVFH